MPARSLDNLNRLPQAVSRVKRKVQRETKGQVPGVRGRVTRSPGKCGQFCRPTLACRPPSMKMHVPKAPWSAVTPATAFPLGIQGGSEAAAVQGASRIFMQRGEPKDHGHLRSNPHSFPAPVISALQSFPSPCHSRESGNPLRNPSEMRHPRTGFPLSRE